MKLHCLSAVLIGFFLLCISVPNLFAQNLSVEGQNKFFNQEQNLFIETDKSDKSKETYLSSLRNRYYLRSASMAKYGFDVISVTSGLQDINSVRLRTGFSNLSKNATAGVQLIVSW